MRYLKALDGLRGIAVLAVITFHYGYFQGGWIGVQIFFVLSGFLITSILLRERFNPLGLYLKRFYWKRILRLFPLYYSYLFVLILIVYVGFRSEALDNLWKNIPYLFSYSYNLTRFDIQWTYNPFITHLWSLCIETQFYLIWPLLVYYCGNRLLRQTVGAIIILGPFVRYALGDYLFQTGLSSYEIGDRIYWFPLSQMDAFAFGAMIPVFKLQDRFKKPAPLLLLVVVTLGIGFVNFAVRRRAGLAIGWTSFGYPFHLLGHFQYVWGYTLLNMCSLVCILYLLNTQSIRWLFSNSLLVMIGKISYGMYVFHLPVQAAFNHIWHYPLRSVQGLCVFGAYLVVVVMVSYASYMWFERRFLALKDTHLEIFRGGTIKVQD